MEQNNTTMKIDQLLDALMRSEMDEKQGKQALAELEVTDTEAAVTLHNTAAAVIQRHETLRQVQQVADMWKEKHIAQQPMQEAQKTLPPVVGMRPLKILLRVAAVVMLTLGGFLFYQLSTTSNEKLYSELYQPYNVAVERSNEKDVNKMVSHYKAKEYALVVKEYELLTVSGNREDFFAGMAYHETGDYNKAVAAFEKIIKENQVSGSRLYNDDTQYYLSLSFIKLKRYNEAYKLLNTIKNEATHTYNEEVDYWLLMKLKYL